MRNRHKPLHDIEKWSIDDSEKKGHKSMNEMLHGLVPPPLGSEKKVDPAEEERKLLDRLDRITRRHDGR
ncbi:MAG TPA: hypothetical protein VE985_00675 [Gaiellaceae bacterium]|nr:hypothetical protein [Gaiellaceae bacterium]